MNMELIKSLKKIEANKELLNKIENFDYSAEDIYNICKEYGFAGSFEEFEKDYEELFSGYIEHIYNVCKENGFTGSFEEFEKDYEELLSGRINEMNEKELSSVSGGKMNKFFSRSTAALLSALTLSTTAMPKSSASNINNEKPSISSRLKNFANKHPLISVATISAGTPALGTTTILLGASAIYAINQAIKNSKRTQYLENLKNDTTIINAVEYFIKEDLGTPVCPFPKNAEEISNDLIAMYSKRDINESIAKYIYKIYNEGNVDMQTISKGLKLTSVKAFRRKSPMYKRLNYLKIAEIIDFIRTSKGIPEDQRETKFNYFLNNFARIGNSNILLDKVNEIKAAIRDGRDLSTASNPTYKVYISIPDEDIEEYHIDIKKLNENFVKSGIIVNEIDKNDNTLSSYSIDKYEKFYGSDEFAIHFVAKNPSCKDVTFTFPEDKGWSREFKICNCEKFRINEALGLVCRHSEGEKHWTLRDVGDTIDFIESFNKNTKDMKEMLNILKEMKK